MPVEGVASSLDKAGSFQFQVVQCAVSETRQKRLQAYLCAGNHSMYYRVARSNKSACQYRRGGFDPWAGEDSPEKKNANLLQYSCLRIP